MDNHDDNKMAFPRPPAGNCFLLPEYYHVNIGTGTIYLPANPILFVDDAAKHGSDKSFSAGAASPAGTLQAQYLILQKQEWSLP
jgi:hypothetical protein